METDVINKKIFRVENLNYYYPNDQIAALRELNFEVDQGEFILVIGRSGSGKSTLARVLSRLAPDFHGGTITGNITFKGEPLWQWNNRQLPAHIGIVFQEAEQQLLMSNVEREIAFGLENLGVAEPQMRRRVAEIMDFLNLNHLRKKPLAELSGGEKQKVALGGVLVMQPEVLILDEPTSQLDPTAAEDFINWIKKINQELGLTVIMFEQRMDMLFPMVDRVMVLDGGKIIFDGLPASSQPGLCKTAM
nr:ABC transporter ATP-binding protein [Syntrophomonas palmitatica]